MQAVHGWLSTYERLVNSQNFFSPYLTQEDILYFESFDHYFKIATKSGDYEFKSTMSEIKEQISEARFVQVHRSYIINYDNTSHIKYEEVTMLNGDVISVSRDRRKEVREIVSEWERGKI